MRRTSKVFKVLTSSYRKLRGSSAYTANEGAAHIQQIRVLGFIMAEEFVPLSNPLRNFCQLGMMSSAMEDLSIPKTKNKTKTKGAIYEDINPLPESHVEGVSIDPETMSANSTLPASSSAASIEKDPATVGSKRQREKPTMWDDTATYTLIRVYKEQWIHINRGNLRQKDWDDITFSLNRDVNGSYNSEQVRNRIDTLKKTHKKEKKKQNSTGSTPSKWPFFEVSECLWGTTPKCMGLVGALDSDGRRSANVDGGNDESRSLPDDDDCQEGGMPRQMPSQMPHVGVDTIELDGVVGKKVKQARRSSLGTISRTMGENMNQLCGTMREVEDKRNATLRELELSRHALEAARLASDERIAAKREEEETKRQQMYVNMQLEIAKLFAKCAD